MSSEDDFMDDVDGLIDMGVLTIGMNDKGEVTLGLTSRAREGIVAALDGEDEADLRAALRKAVPGLVDVLDG